MNYIHANNREETVTIIQDLIDLVSDKINPGTTQVSYHNGFIFTIEPPADYSDKALKRYIKRLTRLRNGVKRSPKKYWS